MKLFVYIYRINVTNILFLSDILLFIAFRYHLFSIFGKLPEKLIFYTSRYAHVNVGTRVKNFFEKFCVCTNRTIYYSFYCLGFSNLRWIWILEVGFSSIQ